MPKDAVQDIVLAIVLGTFSISLLSSSSIYNSSVAVTLMLFFVISTLEYTLIGAISQEEYRSDQARMISFSLMMGAILVLLLSVIQQLTSILLIYPSIVLALSGFTISTILFLWFRRREVSKDDIPISKPEERLEKSIKVPRIPGLRIDRILTVILIISIIVAIGMTVYLIVTPKEGEKFTEFYILGMNGTADEYPTELMAGEVAGVIIGVVNHEYSNSTYLLEVKINETIIGQESIRLSHNETWEEPFEFGLNETGEDQKLEFLLYTQDLDEVYRSLHLWVDVS